MIHVHPVTRDDDDIGERTAPEEPCVAYVVPRSPHDVGCPLCELGCCFLTYRLSADGEPVLIHRMAGTA